VFGWLKRKASENRQVKDQVVAGVSDETARYMMGIKGALGGLPDAMLNDPFVIGIIAMHAAVTLKVATNDQASNVLVESTMIAAVQRTFAEKRLERHEAIAVLIRFKNNPEYAKAIQVVTLILGALYGRQDLAHDPLIVEARARVTQMPRAFKEAFGTTEAEQVAYLLTGSQVIDPLKARYGRREQRLTPSSERT